MSTHVSRAMQIAAVAVFLTMQPAYAQSIADVVGTWNHNQSGTNIEIRANGDVHDASIGTGRIASETLYGANFRISYINGAQCYFYLTIVSRTQINLSARSTVNSGNCLYGQFTRVSNVILPGGDPEYLATLKDIIQYTGPSLDTPRAKLSEWASGRWRTSSKGTYFFVPTKWLGADGAVIFWESPNAAEIDRVNISTRSSTKIQKIGTTSTPPPATVAAPRTIVTLCEREYSRLLSNITAALGKPTTPPTQSVEDISDDLTDVWDECSSSDFWLCTKSGELKSTEVKFGKDNGVVLVRQDGYGLARATSMHTPNIFHIFQWYCSITVDIAIGG